MIPPAGAIARSVRSLSAPRKAPALTSTSRPIEHAAEQRDFWALMTLACIPQMEQATDSETTRVIVERLGGITGRRIADLGSGCGRFSAEFLTYGPSEVVGIEQSPILASMSRGRHPEIPVVVDSFSNLAAYGSFDVVLALSHLLFMADSTDSLLADLRHIRAAMPDYGLLVVEQFEMTASPRRWDTEDLRIEERTSVTSATMLTHRFDVHVRDAHILETQIPSLVLSRSEFDNLARESGFLVSDYVTETALDGQRSHIWVLRAQKGFNYLSDLDEFLESWLTSGHLRNRTTRSIVTDQHGRVRPAGTVTWGQGASLSRNHPEFVDCLEPAIKPLVVELVHEWDLVTYSSCDGHIVAHEPREDYSEAYVGIVTFTPDHLRAVTTLLETAVHGFHSEVVDPVIRQRDLLGPREKFSVADLLLTRRESTVPWHTYKVERDRAINYALVALEKERSQ